MFSKRPARLLTASILTAATLTGCSWVHVRPEAEHIRFAYPAQVRDCKRLGSVSANVLDRVWFIPRSRRKVQSELAVLARNEAASFGANTVAPTGRIDHGHQSFGVYECPRTTYGGR